MASTYYCARCLTTFAEQAATCPNLTCKGPRPARGWGELLGEGDLLDRHYRIQRPLAVGGAGLTYLAREVDGSGQPAGPQLAIKVLYTQRDAGPFLRRLSNEAQILQELDHEHIVKCHGFVQRTGHAPYLVTIFERGGSLGEHVETKGPLPPRVAAAIIRQILVALDVAHERGVVHRDLKPENVLLHEPTAAADVPLVRVADFGIAKVFGGVGGRLTRLGAFVGTPEYAAPEQFEGMAPTPAADVWAAGAVLFFLLTARPPFNFKHRMDIESSYEELLDQSPPRIPRREGDQADEIAFLQTVIDHMLRPEPGERWTVHQVIAELDRLLGDAGLAKIMSATASLTDQGAPDREVTPAPHSTLELTRDGDKAAAPRLSQDQAMPDAPAASMPPANGPTTAWEPAQPKPKEALPAPPPPPVVSAAVQSPPKPAPPKPAPPKPAPLKPLAPAEDRPSAASVIAATSSVPVPRRGGMLGVFGAAGALVAVAGAAIAAVVVLAGAAWYLGFFGGEDVAVVDPVEVSGDGPIDLTHATDPALVEQREAIQAVLNGLGPTLSSQCGLKQEVDIHLEVQPGGSVGSTPVGRQDAAQQPKWWRCSNRTLKAATFPNSLGVELVLDTTLDPR
jgi:serine/threonine protein kinase